MLAPKVVTIDLDDTLWDVHPVISRAETRLRAWLVERYPAVEPSLHQDHLSALRQRISEAHPERRHDFKFLRLEVLKSLLAGAGYDSAAAGDAFAEFDRWRNTVTLFDDVRPALERMATSFSLIALTNGNACVKRVGLGDVFSDAVTAVRAGAPKPSPVIFDFAVDLAGVAPDEILHVGDDAHLDVDAARRAGLKAAWINRRAEPWPDALPEPDHEFSCLMQLADALGAPPR